MLHVVQQLPPALRWLIVGAALALLPRTVWGFATLLSLSLVLIGPCPLRRLFGAASCGVPAGRYRPPAAKRSTHSDR
jgi:hypothetical protein